MNAVETVVRPFFYFFYVPFLSFRGDVLCCACFGSVLALLGLKWFLKKEGSSCLSM